MGNKSRKIIICVILILTILIAGCSNPFSPEEKCVEVPYEEQEEYMKTEYYTESVPYTDRVCEPKKLVYSVTDFKNIANCIDYDERCIDFTLGFCTEKEKYCVEKKIDSTINLKSLDTVKGIWEFEFSYKLDGVLQETNIRPMLRQPQESGLNGIIWTITGEENNKKDARFYYEIYGEPIKEVCRDVTKYRDVERSREVTAYRPVTKYKKECN